MTSVRHGADRDRVIGVLSQAPKFVAARDSIEDPGQRARFINRCVSAVLRDYEGLTDELITDTVDFVLLELQLEAGTPPEAA